MRPARTRVAASALALVAVLAACAGDDTSAPTAATTPAPPAPAPRADPSAGELVLSHLVLGARGVGVAFHPTRRPATVLATADGPLLICPADAAGHRAADGPASSWGRRWGGGCRALRQVALTLPASTGDQHVAVRIVPARAVRTRVARLVLRYRCADGYLAVALSSRLVARSAAPGCGPRP